MPQEGASQEPGPEFGLPNVCKEAMPESQRREAGRLPGRQPRCESGVPRTVADPVSEEPAGSCPFSVTGACYVGQASLELEVLLPQPV